ncbi:MAG: CocE/NonD family hydrolase [Acidobacteriota bacterium]
MHSPQVPFFALTSLLILGLGVFSPAQDSTYIREHYTKFEYRIPMRDGVKLFTSVYVPKDKSRAYPILLTRTPYSVAPYGPDEYLDAAGNQRRRYFQEGYIVAYQDVRGRYMSEGLFVNVRPYRPDKQSDRDIDETTDTYDTVEWLVKNIPGNNGRVGISGISYPGFYTSMAAIDAHPAVKAVSPQAPVSKWMAGDDFFHNGAFLLPHAFDFYIRFGQPRPDPKTTPDSKFDHGTPDGYKFFLEMGSLPNAERKYMKHRVAFWEELMRHGKWDEFWARRNILPHLTHIRPAVLVVGGWFDTENLFGALHTYGAIEKQNPGATNMLVMGPWSHGEWARKDGRLLGAVDFGSRTSDFYTEHVEVPFFNYYLKNQGDLDLSEATVFDTGVRQWRFLQAWPPEVVESKSLYLRAGGKLAFAPPAPEDAGCDEYVSDPSHPVPYTSEITHWYNPSFMLQDQRFAERRPDVLTYESEALTGTVTLAGPIRAQLYVSTSGTDSDWVVKLIDVFPDDTPDPTPNPRQVKLGGYEMLVRGDVLRGKFRNSLIDPEPFVSNHVTPVEFELQDVFHSFEKGHRIMVQIQSTWFPMIDLNPQRFEDVYQAQAKDFQKATQHVCHTPEQASHLTFNVMKEPNPD